MKWLSKPTPSSGTPWDFSEETRLHIALLLAFHPRCCSRSNTVWRSGQPHVPCAAHQRCTRAPSPDDLASALFAGLAILPKKSALNGRSTSPSTAASARAGSNNQDRVTPKSWLCLLSVVTGVVLAEQDAVAQESESGAAVPLPLDHLGLGVHAFGPSVMKRRGDGGDDGLLVQVRAAGDGVQMREVAGPGGLGLVLEPGLVGGVRPEQAAKEPMRAARLVISGRQAAVSPASSVCRASLRTPGRVSRSRVTRRGDRCGRSASALPWVM